ncbi:hypothetical protein OSB04_016745 [Centaurea solstitialis]|uniref:Uncharacterized protein n=1 Tax=Centaurea solstitialis TaxID=347529 RepID=A0AA38TDF9_9ASTR|nr:hypothetical protein OSB04_016745 [Centaurea solstitialis]
MIQSPCSEENINCPCMIDRKCSTNFPKRHTLIEWCNQDSSKYLFKYINKGPDRATVAVVESYNAEDNNNFVDEIKEFYDCRYVSAYEASWCIFGYDVHYRTPSVLRLPFHLPLQQQLFWC